MRLVSQNLLLFFLLLIKGLIICSASLPVEERSNEHVIKRTYDKSGQIATLTSSFGADLTYERNEFGELTCFSAGQAEAPGRFESRHEYDSLGFELERMLPGGVTQSFAYDDIGRLIDSKTRQSSKVRRERKYHWGKADRLLKTEDNRFGTTTYEYSLTGHLQKAVYADGREEYRLSDKAGNLFDDPDRKLRKYLRGGKLEQSGEWRFVYDRDGQLVEKYKGSGKWWDSKSERWRYIWNQNGTLKEVRPPGGGDFAFDALFTYDALGRRLSKDAIGITCWLWNGNVPLHEWTPSQRRNEQGEIEEYQKDLRTWLFEEESFVPLALFQDGKAYSIVTDHLGTPVEAYNEQGEEVWYRRLDMSGKVIEERSMLYTSYKDYVKIPFLFQGQYYDEEIKLAYNRFRYYDPNTGNYICQDPIDLQGGMQLYAYIHDSNSWIDPFGLSGRGGTLHRSIQDQLRDDLKGLGKSVEAEGQIKLKNGQSRFGDLVVRNDVGDIIEVHQIGDMRTRGGFRPSSRERGAIMDIREALGDDVRIVFHDKKGRVTLIDPDKADDWKVPSKKHRKNSYD